MMPEWLFWILFAISWIFVGSLTLVGLAFVADESVVRPADGPEMFMASVALMLWPIIWILGILHFAIKFPLLFARWLYRRIHNMINGFGNQ